MSPARLYANQVMADHGLVPPVPFERLVEVCEAEGAPVQWSLTQQGRGFYLRGPKPEILLRHDERDPKVLAHELFHHLTSDPNEGWSMLAYEAREVQAEAFARILQAGALCWGVLLVTAERLVSALFS